MTRTADHRKIFFGGKNPAATGGHDLRERTVNLAIDREQLSVLMVLVARDFYRRTDRGLDAQARGIDFVDPDCEAVERLMTVIVAAFMEIGRDDIRDLVTAAMIAHDVGGK